MAMVKCAQNHLEEGPFFTTFFPPSLRNRPGFLDQVKKVYGRLAQMADAEDTSYITSVTCDNDSFMCQGPYIAEMEPVKGEMNLCDRFFSPDSANANESQIITSRNFISACKQESCHVDHSDELDTASRTKAVVLVHEMTRTAFGHNSDQHCLDYAYGVGDCISFDVLSPSNQTSSSLAANTFDRSKTWYGTEARRFKSDKELYCPANEDEPLGAEGICKPEFSQDNADSYALVAAGLYFSNQCGKILGLYPYPLASKPQDPKLRFKRGSSCNISLPTIDGNYQPDAVFVTVNLDNVTASTSSIVSNSSTTSKVSRDRVK
ncbi:MAG: hypothetical protein Q9165_005079 [Trypethelium subeluteriae]